MFPKNDISNIGTQVFAQYKKMYEEICQRLKSEKEAQFYELELWKDKYNALQKTFESLNQSKDKQGVKIKQDLNDPRTLNQVPKISGHQQLNFQPNAEKQYFQIKIQQLNDQIAKQKKQIQDLNDKNEKHSIDNKKLEIEYKIYSDQLNQRRKSSQHQISDQQMLQYEDNIQKLIQKIEEMKKEKNNQEKQLEKLTKENQVLNQTNDELRKSIHDHDKGQQQKNQYQLQLSELGLKNSQLQKLVKDLEKQQQHQQDISQQTAKQIEEKQNEIESLKMKIQEYQKELSNLNQLQGVYDEQQEQLQQLAQMIKKLEEKLQESANSKQNGSDKKQLSSKYDQLYQQYTDLQTQDIMKQEWLTLQKTQLEDLKQENEQLCYKIEEVQKQNKVLISQIEMQNEDTKLSFSQLQDQVISYQQIVTDKNEEIHQLKLEVSKQKCHLQNEDYEEKIKQLNNQYEKLESESKMKIEWMEIQNEELEETINEYEKKISNLVEQLSQSNKSNTGGDNNQQKDLLYNQLKESVKERDYYYNQYEQFLELAEKKDKIIEEQVKILTGNKLELSQLKVQLSQMNETSKDLKEMKAFYEQKVIEQENIIQNLQQQRKQTSDQEYYEKMNQILQENEELRQLRSENQEELNKKDQLIEELQMQMLSQSQVTGSSDLQERKRRQELLDKVKEDKSEKSGSSNVQLKKNYEIQTKEANEKQSPNLDQTQDQSKSSKPKSAESLDFQD
ncbi:unnamed protein product (macronuclear) [Paramecium tetraurelia]|uniref:Uncharacterized protein n=1 Tax=Paramecium tetraurelia TaxID=5888 RepID=A0C7Y5_PARTE|nr:uncharacterized protein GSPATT00036033001 [Paramecium tetraurelia]CAK66902.1 unnamed protein product [Paramecium tetraurelia]|eukprot:XP_001434299.1 hypothetical protein (macronuclear) [Paramecium tetraurelia strain d4-2]